MPASAGDGALLEKLRVVRAFGDLTKLPGRVSLADELQRHRGGAAHLDAKYRRKRPPGYAHLIVGNPSAAELKAAWGAFLEGPLFQAGRGKRTEHQKRCRNLRVFPSSGLKVA